MKNLIIFSFIFFAVISGAEENKSWETRPGIYYSGNGYNDTGGAWIYKFYKEYSCPSSLPFDYSYYYVNNHQVIINIGYGDFRKHGGGSLINSDTRGEIKKDSDESWAISYGTGCQSGQGGGPGVNIGVSESERTGSLANAYVYKKTEIQRMSASFGSSSYTAVTGEDLGVTIVVSGGSGYWGLETTKPSFLETEGKGVYHGKSYKPLTCSISSVVTDLVTGQSIGISADIKITEDDGSSNNSGSSGGSSSPSNPGGTVADPGGGNGGDNGTSVGNGDDSSNDNGGAVGPGNGDNSSDTEPIEPGSDNNDDTTPVTEPGSDNDSDNSIDPGSDDNNDTPVEPGNDNNNDSTTNPGDSSGEPVVVVPDGNDAPTDLGNSGSSDQSDGADLSGDVGITEPADSNNDDNDEPTIIVVDNNKSSDNEKIIVTNDSVTTERSENYDLAIFLGMFGAITGMNGSIGADSGVSQAAQQAYEKHAGE